MVVFVLSVSRPESNNVCSLNLFITVFRHIVQKVDQLKDQMEKKHQTVETQFLATDSRRQLY